MTTQPIPTHYTLEEFHRLAQDGLLDDLPRVELLFGQVVTLSPVGLRHRAFVRVIEVADTTLKSDQTIKVPLYAQHEVPQVWVIDLNQPHVWVYQQPAGSAYQQVAVFESDGLLELPELGIAIGSKELLGS